MKLPNFFAFDTETKDGKAFFVSLCTSNNNEAIYVWTLEDCIKVLKKMTRAASRGFAYNLDYDALALFKFFEEKHLLELYLGFEIEIEKLKIKYIKGKCLQIKYGRKQTRIYDLMQFFRGGLANACKQHLPDEFRKVDTNPEHRKNTFKWWQEKPKDFEHYSLMDGLVTYKLGEHFIIMCWEAGIPARAFYSSGYLAMKYLKSHIQIPTIKDAKTNNFIKGAFFGGRVEFVKRGFFPKVYVSDINSAYPDSIANLYTIQATSFDNHIDRNATYFFIDCTLRFDSGNISPLPYRTTNFLIYPKGKFRATIDNYTFGALEPYITSIKLHKVLNVYCSKEKLFKKYIDLLYKKRKENKNNDYIFKLILNSIYGKLAEKRQVIRELSEKEMLTYYDDFLKVFNHHEKFETTIKESCPSCYNRGYVFERCKNQECRDYFREFRPKRNKDFKKIVAVGERLYIKETQTAGNTNLVYAALITAQTRLKMWEATQLVGEENVVGYMTDCIFTTKPLPKNLLGKELGKYTQKTATWMLALGTGIYQHEFACKFRGFKARFDLTELMDANPKKNELNVPSTTRIGTGQLFYQLKPLKELNVIYDNEKTLKVNFDKKRIWNRDFVNFEDARKNFIESKIITI